MKKYSWITGVFTCVMVALAALGCVLNAVWQIAIDETFYNEQSRAAVKTAMGYTTEEEVTAYIGLTLEQQRSFAETAGLYMLGEDQSIDLPLYVSKDEVRHMIDVRGLIWRARDLSKAFLTFAAALAVAAAWTSARLRRRVMPKVAGALGAIALIELVIMAVVKQMQTGGFAHMFTQMHEVLFTNDLWLMDPAKHILIRMMPQPLFEQALVSGAGMALRMFLLVCLLLMAIDFIVGGMIRRHVVKD